MPVLQSSDFKDSKLTLANPALEPATVTFTARSYNGALQRGPGIINPVSLTLSPSSTRTLRPREIFGAGISSGWIELKTYSSVVSGAFFLSDSAQTAMDGGELNMKPSDRLIFPKAIMDPSAANTFTVINTSERPIARGSLLLFDNSGRLVAQRHIAIPPLAGFSGSVSDLVPSVQSFEGYIVVDSNSSEGALIGVETYRNKADIAVLAGVAGNSPLRTGYLPQFATQAGYISTLVLLNNTEVPQTVKTTASITQLESDEGESPALSTVHQTLAPNQRLEMQLDLLFGFDAGTAVANYVGFETEGPGLFGYLESKTADGTITTVQPQTGYTDISFSYSASSRGSYSGLTLVNAGSVSSEITIDALDAEGNVGDSAAYRLGPNSRWSGFLTELLSATDNRADGRIRITASSPILALQLQGSALTGALSIVPMQGSLLPPQLSGQLVSAQRGGTVISDDGSASLSIPPGALVSDSAIRITPLNVADYPEPPGGERLLGIVEGTPAGTHFRVPVRLRFPLVESLQPGATINVMIFNPETNQYDPTEFVAIVESSGRTASAAVTHFTKFAVSGRVTSVQISSINPSSGPVGTLITISGSGFSLSPERNTVSFTAPKGGNVSEPALESSSTSLTVIVPSTAVSGKVYVTVGSVKSNGVRFTVRNIVNESPVVDAGQSQTINLPSGVVLSGAASDDGLPNGGLTTQWSVLTGPGDVMFGDLAALSTSASFSVEGTYELRLTADDGELSSSDDVVITVNSSTPTNQRPVVDAGVDQTITLPSGANLTGTASDDGLPSGNLIASWSVVSGPGAVTFGNPAAFTTFATFSAAGTYTLRLTASDGELSVSDELVIVVNAITCGSFVSGRATLAADAFDNVGVVGVQFKLNGTNWGAELTSAPYSVTWDTTTVPNGCYTVAVVARDAAGNQGAASMLVTVSNP